MAAPHQHRPSTELVRSEGSVLPFNYGSIEVRTVTIDGEPWFVAADVCAVLDIGDARRAVQRLDQADRTQTPISSGGQRRNMWVVNESGLYDLVVRSDKEEARPFRRWITSEVLPTIRRTGSYTAEVATIPAPRSQIDVLRGVLDEIEAVQQQAAEAVQRATLAEESSAKTNARLDAIEGKHEWFAALGYARLHGLPTERVYLQRLGSRAGVIGRENGLTAAKVQHGLYGQVNQWPAWCWDQAVDEMEEGL